MKTRLLRPALLSIVPVLAWCVLPDVAVLARESSVPAACVEKAASLYGLPPAILWAILGVEGGEVGTLHPNNNGTFDIGPMQINTTWLPELWSRFGITWSDLAMNPCLNVATGAWILKRNQLDSGDFWVGTEWYHSSRPKLGRKYAVQVWLRVLRDAGYRVRREDIARAQTARR